MKISTQDFYDIIGDLRSISQNIAELSEEIEELVKESLPANDIEALTSDYI